MKLNFVASIQDGGWEFTIMSLPIKHWWIMFKKIRKDYKSIYIKVLNRLCKLYCTFDHVDFCDTRYHNNKFFLCIVGFRVLPSSGNLNQDFPVGRFWRFQALGDPTVRLEPFNINNCIVWILKIRKFASRDVDSWILPRERDAVNDWEDKGSLSRIQIKSYIQNPFSNRTMDIVDMDTPSIISDTVIIMIKSA